MKNMPISQFKTHALKVIDNINKNLESVIITKRGKPVAEISPFHRHESHSKPGKLAHTLVSEKDIITPFNAELWEANK